MPEQVNINLPEGSIEKQTTRLNLGPTHPATHGVFQNILEMDGERIVKAESTVGYIHRAFEKLAERRPLYQITTLTDRLNYCSAPLNNMGWHMTCEKLLGVKTPKRVDYLRVIIMGHGMGRTSHRIHQYSLAQQCQQGYNPSACSLLP